MNPTLPSPTELEVRCRALALLDAVMCADWDDRHHSFDASWAPGMRMASMRDGSGDHWFILFLDGSGCGLVGLAHESEAFRARAVDPSSVPEPLVEHFVQEPAFDTKHCSFMAWRLEAQASWTWLRSGKPDGADELMNLLVGPALRYAEFAQDYFELDEAPPIDRIESVFRGIPPTERDANALNPHVEWTAIREELRAIAAT
jgi:hypothetical protein